MNVRYAPRVLLAVVVTVMCGIFNAVDHGIGYGLKMAFGTASICAVLLWLSTLFAPILGD
jgi:hypothetical protein